jgi:hypothetical protein
VSVAVGDVDPVVVVGVVVVTGGGSAPDAEYRTDSHWVAGSGLAAAAAAPLHGSPSVRVNPPSVTTEPSSSAGPGDVARCRPTATTAR